jgi:pimeloyl-ACP methyl ester carboxylesterase
MVVVKMFEFLIARADATEWLRENRPADSLVMALHVGEEICFVVIDDDGLRLGSEPPTGQVDFALHATAQTWESQRLVKAPRGFQALSTMRRLGHLTVSGNLLAYNQHLLYLEQLFTPSERSASAHAAPVEAPFVEPIVGRYLQLTIEGRVQRIYFEEAGEGIPLVCLHTAGADGRQYREILNDEQVTDRFRVIVFDLPWHGKSSPPAGFENEVYRLTTTTYVNTIMAVCRALDLNNPVVMGCSIGGRVVLHLARQHADELRAVIGLQSALYAVDKTGNVEQGSERILHRPDVHGGEMAGALMNGVMAPASPAHSRWETMWHYMQGGPGVFMGDLHYYFTDGDLRQDLAGLNMDECPVYLLSGEYDPSATPEMSAELAELINPTHFEVMKDMGHFPMSENPAMFRQYLLPVLERIASI